jgi:hypothetical protein
MRTVRPYLRTGEVATMPVLSFDRFPARLAWSVQVAGADGTRRLLYVAGEAVWEGPSPDPKAPPPEGSDPGRIAGDRRPSDAG